MTLCLRDWVFMFHMQVVERRILGNDDAGYLREKDVN
jgi:hypothetical protein